MNRQRGATFWQMLLIVVLLGFAGLMAARLVPVYMEGYFVKFALERLEKDRTLSNATNGEIWQALNKQLQLDNVDSVKRDNLRFEEVTNGRRVIVDYERRVPLIGNLDGVVHFENSAVITR